GYSHRLWLGLSRRLGHNVMYTQRGYAILAESERTAGIIEESLRTQRDCGVASRRLPTPELQRCLPAIDNTRRAAGMILEGGRAEPHRAVMKGLRAACEAKGVALHYGTVVTGIERAGARAAGVWCGADLISADATVIAAGGHSPAVAGLAGVELE